MSIAQQSLTEPVAVVGEIADAWRAHDADRFAQVFVPDGSMTLPGVFLRGREAIREFMQQAFDGPYRGTQVVGTPVAVRPLGTEAVILNTEGGVVRAGESELAADQSVNATWVVARHDGEWRLFSYQNTPKSQG